MQEIRTRIMLIVANLQGGGQERIVALTSKLLCKKYSITLVTFKDNDEKYEIPQSVTRINLNIPESNNIISKIINILKRTIRIKRLKKELKIDCCISYGNSSNIINSLSARNEKTILSIRNATEYETGKNILNSYMFRKCDVIYCISNGQRIEITQNFKKYEKKIITIHNPCNISDIEAKTTNQIRKEYSLVSCGRLEPVKCYKNLINAVSFVRIIHPEVTLTIIGSGSQEKELKRYINDKDYTSWVEFIPFTNNPFEIISRKMIFVYTSCSEGFGNVLVEALACETPVVSTDCNYGPREILSGTRNNIICNGIEKCEYGILSPVFDINNDKQEELEKTFAKAINLLLENSSLYDYYKSKARERSMFFSIDHFLYQVEKMIID